MASTQAILILGQKEDTSVQVSHLWPRAPGLASKMVQGITRIVATFLTPPGAYSSPCRIIAPPQANPILVRWKILLFRCPTSGLLVGAISGQGPVSLTSIMVLGLVE